MEANYFCDHLIRLTKRNSSSFLCSFNFFILLNASYYLLAYGPCDFSVSPRPKSVFFFGGGLSRTKILCDLIDTHDTFLEPSLHPICVYVLYNYNDE